MTPFTTSPMVDSLSQTPQSTPRDLSSHAAPSLNAGSPVWWVSGESQSLVSSLRDVDEKAGSFPGTILSPSRSQRESGGLHRRRHDSSSPPLRTPSLTPSCLTPSNSMGSSASESGTGAIGLGLFGVPDLTRAYRGEDMMSAAPVSQDIPLKRVFKPRKSSKSLRQREAAFPVPISSLAPSPFSSTPRLPSASRMPPARSSSNSTTPPAPGRMIQTVAAVAEMDTPYMAYVPRMDDALPVPDEDETLEASESGMGERALKDSWINFTPHKPTLDMLVTPPRSLHRPSLELPSSWID